MCARLTTLLGCVLATLLLGLGQAAAQTAFDAELRGLLKLHSGSKTDLDAVERVGADLLERYEEPQYQAQVYYTLAHVHAQAAMREPEQIEKYGQLALDSRLITPGQRATIYSYLCSAIEVQRDKIKEFPERRKAAALVLLKGLGELALLKIPEKEPPSPRPPPGLEIGGDVPGEPPRPRAAAEAYQRARDEHERIRDLIFRRKVLTDQLRYLYVRDPANLEELRELATKAIGEAETEKLAAAVTAERERIEKARKEAIEKAKRQAETKANPPAPQP
jgi:hypothetical protein